MKQFTYIESPELASVHSASRLTALIISTMYVIAFNLIFIFYSTDRGIFSIGAVALAYLFLFSSMIFYKEDFSSLLALIALFTTSLTLTFQGSNSDIQATASTAIFLSVVLAISTLPKKWIFGYVMVSVILMSILVMRIGHPTEIFKNEIPIRTFSVIQLIVVAIWFYRSWFPQLEFVRARDTLNKRMLESRESAIELQERTRTWRELLIHTHETVLNDIRAVLDSKNVDFKELKKQLNSRKRLIPVPQSTEQNFSDLMAQVQDSLGIEIDLNISGAGTEIPINIYSALRSVIVEISRNFERHAGATRITSKASSVYGVLRIELFHNGKDSTSNFESGIGQGVVIKETLNEINAKLFRRINGVELSVALKMRKPSSRTLSATDVGRISISAVTAGNAVGGVLFTLGLFENGNIFEQITAVSTFALTIFAALVTFRKVPLSNPIIIGTGIVGTIQGISTYFAIPNTFSIDLLAINAVLTGFALVAITTWAQNLKFLTVSFPWFISLIAFRFLIEPETSGTAIASLNTGYAIPAFAGAVIFSSARTTRRLNESEDLSELELRESSAAMAVADLASELDSAISEATKTLSAIAKEEYLSTVNKNSLKRLDSLIRAIIQVDPKTSGGFAKAALAIVQHAASVNVYMKVLAVRDQGLLAELSDDLLDELKRLVSSSRDSKTSIQVLADTNSSILVIKVSASTSKRASLDALNKYNSEELKVYVEDADGDKIIFVEQVVV